MNSVSFKNASSLKKSGANFQLLKALQADDKEALRILADEHRRVLASPSNKFEPHTQNLDLVEFLLTGKKGAYLRRVGRSPHEMQKVREFVKLAMAEEGTN